jgi:hypothetical protein
MIIFAFYVDARGCARAQTRSLGVTVARLFVPQEALEAWLAAGRVHMVGETLFIDGYAFSLESALRFVNEVAGGGDELQLLGRVKTLEQLAALGGEHCAASVVLGDNAYEVIEGFVAGFQNKGGRPADHEQLVGLFAQR